MRIEHIISQETFDAKKILKEITTTSIAIIAMPAIKPYIVRWWLPYSLADGNSSKDINTIIPPLHEYYAKYGLIEKGIRIKYVITAPKARLTPTNDT